MKRFHLLVQQCITELNDGSNPSYLASFPTFKSALCSHVLWSIDAIASYEAYVAYRAEENDDELDAFLADIHRDYD